MAANVSVYESCEQHEDEDELFHSALGEYFAELTLDTDEYQDFSRINTNRKELVDATTIAAAALEAAKEAAQVAKEAAQVAKEAAQIAKEAAEDAAVDADFQLALITSTALRISVPPLTKSTSKEFLQSTSSTPKRKLQFARAPRHSKLIAQLGELAEESGEQQQQTTDSSSSGGSNVNSCATAISSKTQAALDLEAQLETLTQVQLPSLSLIMRQHRGELILSPLSQKLKNAIMRQDVLRKRQQRIELSRKAQRISLRV